MYGALPSSVIVSLWMGKVSGENDKVTTVTGIITTVALSPNYHTTQIPIHIVCSMGGSCYKFAMWCIRTEDYYHILLSSFSNLLKR